MPLPDLDARFGFLDDLPDTLFEAVVTTRHGRLETRVAGVLAWRAALLAGRLPRPGELAWPEPAITRRLLPRLEVLELAGLCRGEESLTDQVLKDILQAVDSLEAWREQGIDGLFEDVAQQQRRERHTPPQQEPEGEEDLRPPEGEAGGDTPPETGASAGDEGGMPGARPPGQAGETGEQTPAPGEAGPEGAETIAHPTEHAGPEAEGGATPGEGMPGPPQAGGGTETGPFEGEGGDPDGASGSETAPAGAVAPVPDDFGEALARHWQGLVERWRETDAVVKGMATRLGRGWDLSRGVLVSEGWQQFVKLRHWIRMHPELVAIVDRLGREHPSGGDGTVDEVEEQVEDQATGEAPRPLEVIRSESPMSTRGVSRSDDIARMLPQEAAFLGHPALHLLWHARRAERALLSYQVEGVLSEHQPQLTETLPLPRKRRRRSAPRRGPVILCLDTSASMQGEPEWMAKAIALEVMRQASAEGRDALLFAFSGPGQLLELPLTFTPGGLKRVIRFLQQSFRGGTDIRGPLERALMRIDEQRWRKADMLLVSDGRFPVPEPIRARVRQERERDGLRIQGIIVGRWSSRSMERICDSVHRFQQPARR
ncbi:MAG TPA: VWA domain-containing protein [Sedimenticola sp.]|nr:VWA domain-containing protein [Sedimenticola sp.]